MKLSSIVLILTIFANIHCFFGFTSQTIVEALYRENQPAHQTNESSNLNIMKILHKQVKLFIENIKSPKGYESPNICIWKICSKPLKKYMTGRPPNSNEKVTRKSKIAQNKWSNQRIFTRFQA